MKPTEPDPNEAAQQAAMDAVGGGPEGAAAVAAGRAAAAGMMSHSGGLASLGGLQKQIEALRNSVLLPLQVKCPYTWARQSCCFSLHPQSANCKFFASFAQASLESERTSPALLEAAACCVTLQICFHLVMHVPGDLQHACLDLTRIRT